jgi:hypothetical protein
MSRRSGNSRGGMQSAGVHPSIYCQVCEKPAARYEPRVGWMHFTKTGSVWHKEKPDQNPKRLGF